MHPSLEQFVGKQVELEMTQGWPWFGVRIAGVLDRAPDGAQFVVRHERAGDVVFLPSAVRGIAGAKARA